jgi:hypothetical protein
MESSFENETLIPFSFARDLQLSATSARLLSLAEVMLRPPSSETEKLRRFFTLIPILSGVVKVEEPVESIERRLGGV